MRTRLAGSAVVAPHGPDWSERQWSSRTIHRVGEIVANSGAGMAAAACVVGWFFVGLSAGFPSWWQIALYSTSGSTTLVMVFVIQHTQQRQTVAIQRKLDELIRTSHADDRLIGVD